MKTADLDPELFALALAVFENERGAGDWLHSPLWVWALCIASVLLLPLQGIPDSFSIDGVNTELVAEQLGQSIDWEFPQ